MKNLWLFFVRYNAFFWFILFFGFTLILTIQNNAFQKSHYLSSSNKVIGSFYQQIDSWKEYLSLEKQNRELSEENAKLRSNLYGYAQKAYLDSVKIKDSVDIERYHFTPAKVINNSIHQKNNYITLNKGAKDGIKSGMGVITSNGVVGIVLNVSPHFSTVQSLLHTETKVSVTLDSLGIFASLVWGDNTDSRFAMVQDIPNHIKVKKGNKIYTSGYSLFPEGIEVGEVVETEIISGDSFKNIRILLTTNFSSLQHVYVVDDVLGAEKKELEELEESNGKNNN